MKITLPHPSRIVSTCGHVAVSLAFLYVPELFAAGNGTWLNTGSSSDWSSTGNWVGGTVAGSTTLLNTDVATFDTSVGTVGTAGNPIIIDTASWTLKNIVFDSANVGSFYIGTAGGNTVRMTSGGAITMNSGVTSSQTINAPLAIQSTSGTLSLVNDASSSAASLNIGGAITSGAASGTTVAILGGSNTGNNIVSGVIGGGSGATIALIKRGTGTWTLTGANTYTGATTLQQGNLVLDFAAAGAPTSNIINGLSALSFGPASSSTSASHILTINGKANTANTQTFGAVTFNSAAAVGGSSAHINLTAGPGTGTLALTLGTLGNKVGGATLDFGLSANTSVKVGTASAATGTGSGLFANAITINGTDFATNNANAANDLVGLSTISGAYETSTAITANSAKALDVQGNTSITSSGATATLPAIRFNQTAANTLTIATGKTANLSGNGAILVTANVGANTTTITGGTITGVTGRDLSLMQNNTQGKLQIDSVVGVLGASGVTKSGRGLAVLSGANTYTGKTFINEGTLQFAKQVALYNNTTASWTVANIFVGSGSTLALNVGGSGEFTTSDVATLSGLGTATGGLLHGSKLGLNTSSGNFSHTTAITDTNSGANSIGLRKLGSNTLTLAGTNTYTGGTTVEQGTLALTQNFTMSGSNGLTINDTSATVAGVNYAQLAFSGTTLTYGGTLDITFNGTLSTGAVYDLFNLGSGSASGDFSEISISGSYETALSKSGAIWTGSDGEIQFSFNQTTGDLTISAIPEPSSIALLAGGLILSTTVLRRRPRR